MPYWPYQPVRVHLDDLVLEVARLIVELPIVEARTVAYVAYQIEELLATFPQILVFQFAVLLAIVLQVLVVRTEVRHIAPVLTAATPIFVVIVVGTENFQY